MTSQLLDPPKPPTLHETGCLLLASSGFYIRFHEEGIAYGLNDKVGNTR